MAEEPPPATEASEAIPRRDSAASSVASGLAAMILEERIQKGEEVEIPSVGVTIRKEDLAKSEPADRLSKIKRLFIRSEEE